MGAAGETVTPISPTPKCAAFLGWARPYVTGERAVRHEWDSHRLGSFRCESVFEAYLKFEWPFSEQLPGESTPTRRRSMRTTSPHSIACPPIFARRPRTREAQAFLTAATAVVEWGGAGVRRNRVTLEQLGTDTLRVVCADAARLDPARADLDRLNEINHLNSGFSKIHALLLDGFPIYDSRVACALASMVRRSCEENGCGTVPWQLAFSIPPSQGRTKRNPSCGSLRFRHMRWRDAKQYASSNVIAAWLLGDLAAYGPFGELPQPRRLLALQSAMFMLGYRPILGTPGPLPTEEFPCAL